MIYRHMNAKDVYTTTKKNNMQFFKTYFSVCEARTQSQKVLVTALSLRSFSILSLINIEMDCSSSPNFLSTTQN